MKATINALDTEGKPQKVQVETTTPKLKTNTKEGVYVLEDLMKFAETGELSEDMKTSSPALLKMTQKAAVNLLVDALAANSEYVTEVVATKEKKAKDEKPPKED